MSTIRCAILKTVIAGVAVQLPNIPCREITLIGLKRNIGSVYIGGVGVSSTVYGVELEAKDSFTFPVSNANLLYIVADVAQEGISYVAI